MIQGVAGRGCPSGWDKVGGGSSMMPMRLNEGGMNKYSTQPSWQARVITSSPLPFETDRFSRINESVARLLRGNHKPALPRG